MNLSGSSSSLTSDASTKAGTVSLRSYGIGGALLHKRIQMITRQNSRERPRDIKEEEEEEDVDGEKESEGERKRQDTRGRQQSHRRAQVALKPPSSTGCVPSLPGVGPMSPPPFSQHHKFQPKPPESPIRTRLMSPFRALRERSRSRERPEAARPRSHGGGIKAEAPPSSKEDKREEERAKRSVSPNPFLWLCRARHVRSHTL